MRRIKHSRKLVLDRSSLRLLTPMQLERVAGGLKEGPKALTMEEDCAFDDTFRTVPNAAASYLVCP
jgi:hypothetical protein